MDESSAARHTHSWGGGYHITGGIISLTGLHDAYSDLVPGVTRSLVIWYRGYQITGGYQITVTPAKGSRHLSEVLIIYLYALPFGVEFITSN